jgi:ligand-binding sensor domain-containing protein/anti-sigma regulatory factor (Ser/Thr protein kinase)
MVWRSTIGRLRHDRPVVSRTVGRTRSSIASLIASEIVPTDLRRQSPSSLPVTRPLRWWLILLLSLVPGVLPHSSAQRWHASATHTPPRAQAQPFEDLAHMSWTRRDGAPSDIAALSQTKDGYLWIGSSFGLFRFDGTRFQSYPFSAADPRLPASNIAALAADREGGLWIGYRMGGISYLRNGSIVNYDKHSGLVGQSTEQLVCRDDGSVWGIADGLMVHLVGNRWETFSADHGLSSDGLFSLFFDRDGNLWTADKGHVFELHHGEAKFSTVSIPPGVVNQFVQLADGTMWISDAWKNVRPLNENKSAHAVRIPGVPTLMVDKEGSIWLANEFGGLTRIQHPGTAAQLKDDFKTENGLTDGQTHAMLEDRQGTIWVGTARGLDRFRHTPLVPFLGVRLEYYPALLADREDGIWLHDMDKPLMRLRAGELSFLGKGHGSSSLFQDTDGSVWLLDQITRDFYRYPERGGLPTTIHAPPVARNVETWCMGKDVQGAFIACFEGHGLWRYDGTAWAQVNAPDMPDESPLSMVKGKSGRVWLGYAHNQIVLDDAQGFRTFGAQQGLELNSVFSFYDADGLVLAGGSDGLAYFDGRVFHTLHLRSPDLLRGISGIVKDRSGDLWLNAASGVIRLPFQQWKTAVEDPRAPPMDFQLLNEQDGLIGTPAQNKPTPSAVIDTHGVLWFATSGHLVSLDPARLQRAVSTPKVLLQSVVVNGSVRPWSQDETIQEGSRRLKTLEFDYIGVDLNAPDRVVYQYMLEGEDKDWQDAGTRRQAYYTNLSPGSYHFRVRAASGTGPWSALPSGPRLVLKPPYYQTTWFYILCGVLLCGLLWLLFRLRVRQLTEQVRGRSEERARERVRIARDLHDTLLQGIQGLVLRFHFATEQLPANEPVRAMLSAALDRADQVIQEGREKVTELRAEIASPAELEKHLKLTADALQAESSCRITVIVNGEPRPLHIAVQDELYSVGREALTNAVRHSQGTQVLLELAYGAQQLSLRCSDNGSGVSRGYLEATQNQGHWGIIGMQERARSLGCKLEFASAVDGGTEVAIRVPAKTAYASSKPRKLRLPRVLLGGRPKPTAETARASRSDLADPATVELKPDNI